MKVLKRFLLFGIIAGVTVFTSCEDDSEGSSTLNKDEAKAEIQENSTTLTSTMNEMENTEGMKAMDTLMGIVMTNDPFSSTKDFALQPGFVRGIKNIMNPNNGNVHKAGSSHFVFSDHYGTYSWESENTWTVVQDDPSDAIVIEFPTEPANFDQTGNNAVLTISNYAEQEVITDTDSEWVPVTLNAKLEIDGTKYVEVAYSLTLDNEGNPTEIDMSLYLKPFTYALNLTSNSIQTSLSKDGVENSLLSANLEFTFMDSEMEDLERVDGNIQLGNMNMDGWVKPYALQDSSIYEGIQNPGDIADKMNEQMDIKVYKYDTGDKLANLIFTVNESSQYAILGNIILAFEFKDGSTEDAGPYFEAIIGELEQLNDEVTAE